MLKMALRIVKFNNQYENASRLHQLIPITFV